MESNNSPEIPDRGETSDIPGLPSGVARKKSLAVSIACMAIYYPTPGFKGRTFRGKPLSSVF